MCTSLSFSFQVARTVGLLMESPVISSTQSVEWTGLKPAYESTSYCLCFFQLEFCAVARQQLPNVILCFPVMQKSVNRILKFNVLYKKVTWLPQMDESKQPQSNFSGLLICCTGSVFNFGSEWQKRKDRRGNKKKRKKKRKEKKMRECHTYPVFHTGFCNLPSPQNGSRTSNNVAFLACLQPDETKNFGNFKSDNLMGFCCCFFSRMVARIWTHALPLWKRKKKTCSCWMKSTEYSIWI